MIAHMDNLREMYVHSKWADARVFKVCLASAPNLLDETAGGTVSMFSTLGAAGISVPDLDYVIMLAKTRSLKAAP